MQSESPTFKLHENGPFFVQSESLTFKLHNYDSKGALFTTGLMQKMLIQNTTERRMQH